MLGSLEQDFGEVVVMVVVVVPGQLQSPILLRRLRTKNNLRLVHTEAQHILNRYKI